MRGGSIEKGTSVMSNFEFLKKSFPSLNNLGTLAETYLYNDPSAAIMKLGILCESMIELIYKYDKIPLPNGNTAIERIKVLARDGILSREFVDSFHLVLKARNNAAHNDSGSTDDVKRFLPMVHSIAWWFASTYGDLSIKETEYILPLEQDMLQVSDTLEQELDGLVKQDDLKAKTAQKISKAERSSRSCAASKRRPKTEGETRLLIDEQLRQVGWKADSNVLKYSSRGGGCPC